MKHERFKFWQAFLLFSLLIMAFCLGLGWAMIKPMPVRETKETSRFQSPAEPLPTDPPPKDDFLVYPRNAEILFFDNSMKIQRSPFVFYQIQTTDRAERVIEWYGDQWSKKDLLVKGTSNEVKGRVEAIDYHNRRFLNVHISWNASIQRTEIKATAISIPKKQPRYLQNNQKNDSWVTEGETANGGRWLRETRLLNLPLEQARTHIVNEALSEGFEYQSERKVGEQWVIAMQKPRLQIEKMVTLSLNQKNHGTVIQEMTIYGASHLLS